MKKWSEQNLANIGSGYWPGCPTIEDAADHIRELQVAVKDLRDRCVEYSIPFVPGWIDNHFWPADDAETREDPEDNWPGHEW